MKKILSFIFAVFIFFNFSGVALAQEATVKAGVKATLKPTPKVVSVNKVLSSVPKISFVLLSIVLVVLGVQIAMIKRKKAEEERAFRVGVLPMTETNVKTRNVLAILILVFVLIAIPLTLILVKQRQEVRKRAVEPAVCCRIMAKNLCSGGFGSFDLFVREFATEAECDAYLQHPEPQPYSCNCDESCTVGNDHDPLQSCVGIPNALQDNIDNGKSRCTTSGSTDFRKEIVNPAACATATTPPTFPPTAAPTAPPTTPPTAAPTLPPTTSPTAATTPTRTPTPTPVSTRTPTATPVPTSNPIVLLCNQGPCNAAGMRCGSGLVCIHDTWFGHDQWVCRNSDCQIESDCICKQAQVTSTPLPPIGAPKAAAKPIVPAAGAALPSPTTLPPVIPQAGIDSPTLLTIATGVLLLIAGLALAL